MQEAHLNIMKAIYDTPLANTVLKVEKLNAFPLKTETKQVVYSLHSHPM
jgi:hypothetical protein